jgi:hypothetical protein
MVSLPALLGLDLESRVKKGIVVLIIIAAVIILFEFLDPIIDSLAQAITGDATTDIPVSVKDWIAYVNDVYPPLAAIMKDGLEWSLYLNFYLFGILLAVIGKLAKGAPMAQNLVETGDYLTNKAGEIKPNSPP